ncbi:MAG: hypothetical protein AAF602_06785 [Myxococcota bacterium]
MRPTWLFLGLLTSVAACSRVPVDEDADADADADTDADSDTDSDADTDSDTDADPNVECGEPPMRGAWWDDHPLNGLTLTNTAPQADAGLAAVRAAGEGVSELTVLETPLQVRGAVVSLVGFRPSGTDVLELYVNDSSGGMYLRFVTIPESAGIDNGDIVDFDVNVVNNFGGLAQVVNETTGSPDFTVLTEGIENLAINGEAQAIYVVDAAAEAPLSVAEHGHAIIEAYGEILTEGVDCGSNDEKCYDLEYAEGQTITFRSRSEFIQQGDCIQYVGPMGAFNTPQIDATNFDWSRSY